MSQKKIKKSRNVVVPVNPNFSDEKNKQSREKKLPLDSSHDDYDQYEISSVTNETEKNKFQQFKSWFNDIVRLKFKINDLNQKHESINLNLNRSFGNNKHQI